MTDEQIKEGIENFTKTYFGEDFTFRPYQYDSIFNVIKSFDSGKKAQIISAPTGSGKSLIAIISSGVISDLYNKKSYIMCSDLGLYEQYINTIKKFKLPFGYIKGRQNYKCALNEELLSEAACTLQKVSYKKIHSAYCKNPPSGFESCEKICPYIQDKVRFIKSKVSVLTYQYYFTVIKSPDFERRDFIVCDEAHKIPDIIQGHFSLEISEEICNDIFALKTNIVKEQGVNSPSFAGFRSTRKDLSLMEALNEYYPSTDDVRSLFYQMLKETNKHEIFNSIESIIELLSPYVEYGEEYSDYVKEMSEKNPDAGLLKEDKTIYNHCKSIMSFNESCVQYKQIIEEDEIQQDAIVKQNISNKDGTQYIKLNCIHENALCNMFLHGDDIQELLLSATFPKQEVYEQNLGYEKDDVTFTEVPSTFNFDKSPIFVMPECRLSYKEKEKNLPIAINKIIEILEEHKDERGIIHTGSFEFSKKLYEKLSQAEKKRILFYSNSDEKAQVLKKLEKVSNGVLVGPSLLEGLDLKDDLCRFIIVMKVPYASLGDALVAEKNKLISGWYSSDAMCKILQGIGRGIRSETDWAETYIIDGCFIDLFMREQRSLQDYIKKRFRIVK